MTTSLEPAAASPPDSSSWTDSGSKCRKLAALPGTLGRSRPELRPDIRSFAFGNYVIFFRYKDDTVEVVNILEGHRDIDAYFRDDTV